MEKPLLRDPDVNPSDDILLGVLGDTFPVYDELRERTTGEGFRLTHEWKYYKDGHAWLCKVCHKKKTMFWLSVWDKYFKTTFYFTERTRSGISNLGLGKETVKGFAGSKPSGKLYPHTITVRNKEQIKDVLKIAAYKMSLK